MVRTLRFARSAGKTIIVLIALTSVVTGFNLVSPVYLVAGAALSLPGKVGIKRGSRYTSSAKRLKKPAADDPNNWFVSNNGSDSNNGQSATAPKLHLDSIEVFANSNAIAHNGASVALDANSTFREQYNNYANNVNIDSYQSRKRLAKITGMDVISQWAATAGRKNVYEHLLNHQVDLHSPGYNYIMVAEIDTLSEKRNAVTALKYLRLAGSLDECENVAGTYYTVPLSINPITVWVHPTDGAAGSNRFRYEATTRQLAIDGFYVSGATYQHLFLQSGGYGYGALAAGYNSTVRNIIFQGGGTHHLVIRNGVIDSCLFLPGSQGLKDRIAIVYSEEDAKGKGNILSNTIFSGIPYPLYSHTDGLSNFRFLDINKVYCFGDTADASVALSAENTDSLHLSNSYVEGYQHGWDGALGKLVFDNCIFRNISHTAIRVNGTVNKECRVDISNTLIVTNANDRNQAANDDQSAIAIRTSQPAQQVNASHLVVHAYSTWSQAGRQVRIFQAAGSVNANGNIYICDVNDNNQVHVHDADNSAGAAANVQSDNNVFVLLRGGGFNWNVSAGNSKVITSLAQWQALTGQDRHSILIDLRNNPLGLKAIFADPENGNWTLADSPQAVSVKSLSAGLTTPPLFYPERPLLKDNATPFTLPGGFSSFTAVSENDSSTETHLSWQTFNESDAVSFQVEYSTNGTRFDNIGNVTAAADSKSHAYAFTTSEPLLKFNYFRIKRVFSDSTYKYSNVIRLEKKVPADALPAAAYASVTVYPNPSRQSMTINHPVRDHSVISIYDLSGRLLQHIDIPPGASQSQLSLDRFVNGTYIIRWTGDPHESYTTSVLKNN
jgi:hypothetical protein